MKPLSSFVGAFAVVALSASAVLAQGSGPITEPDSASLNEDTLVVVYPLLNDTDPQGAGLTLVSVATPIAGTVRIDGPAIVYTPDPDWNGSLTLIYTARSAGGDSTEEIAVTVHPVNDAPIANDDTATVATGQVAVIDVLANDSDVDGDDLVIGTVNSPTSGTVSVISGVIRYQSESDFAGTDSFIYSVFDAAGESAQGSVTVTITGPPPTTTVAPTTTLVPATTVSPTTAAPTTTSPPATTVAPATIVPPTTVPATTVPPTTVPATTVPPATTPAPVTFMTGTTLVPSPVWAAPVGSLIPPPGTGNPSGFIDTLQRSLSSLAMPLLLLAALGLLAWIVSQRGRKPGREYAVVLVGRDDTLAVYEKPSAASKVLHNYPYSARQIEVAGGKRSADGVSWLPVSTANGRGWVNAANLTEDVARTTFDSDLADRDLIRELRRKLKQGSTLNCSNRGVIDPETFERDPSRRHLGGYATAKLATLIGDWRAAVHIDKAASLAALRPPELRNLHWVSLDAPGLDPWQLFFEYHEGQAYPVAALPENATVPV
ncbi:MAG: tandem-95 repeat protein [bacterium]|nr:tandem-95 repeat protein [bacterium]